MKSRHTKKVYAAVIAAVAFVLLSFAVCIASVFKYSSDISAAYDAVFVLSAAVSSPLQSLAVLNEQLGSAEAPREYPSAQQVTAVPDDVPANHGAKPTLTSDEISAEISSVIPEIPEQYRAPLVSQSLAGGDGKGFLKIGSGYLRNDTPLASDEILSILNIPSNVKASSTTEPQVLIFHTHTTESYEPYDSEYYDTRGEWRTTDNSQNMAAVGDVLADTLKQLGITAIHDTTQHDYPSYNGSYARSAETVSGYLEKYPSIKVVLDIHRDATQSGDEIIKPITKINGKKAAQVMIIAPYDDGSLGVPNWRENLRFAAAVQNTAEHLYPTLTRPLFFCSRKYNMHLCNGALLLEFGSHGNTLEEAKYSAQLIAECIAEYLKS